MRLFLGLDVHLLEMDLKKLKVNLNKAKNMEHHWVPADQRFIPLLSLGEMGHDAFQEFDIKIQEVISHQSPFNLKFEGVWGFPEQAHARVLWVGVQNSKELRSFYEKLSSHLNLGEEEFKPHLPIVRLRNYKEVSDLLSPHKNSSFGSLTISHLRVYDMVLGGAFPKYQLIKEYSLSDSLESSLG